MWGIIGEIVCDNFQHLSGIKERLFRNIMKVHLEAPQFLINWKQLIFSNTS